MKAKNLKPNMVGLTTLKEARTAKGWTLEQLAKESGVTWSTIQAIESGRTPGSLIDRHRIADALGIPLRLIWPESIEPFRELMESLKKIKLESQDKPIKKDDNNPKDKQHATAK